MRKSYFIPTEPTVIHAWADNELVKKIDHTYRMIDAGITDMNEGRNMIRNELDLPTIDNTYRAPQITGNDIHTITSSTTVPNWYYAYTDNTALPIQEWARQYDADKYETVIKNDMYILRRKSNNKEDPEDHNMEEINIEDTSVDNTPEYYRDRVPGKGWYTQVGKSGIEYCTLLSGTFKMKDEGILQEIVDRILGNPVILLNHESTNPVDGNAIRVYYTREDTIRNIVTSTEVTQLIGRKGTYFLGYIPGERGEYLNNTLVEFWKGNRYTHTRVEPICMFHSISAPGKDTKFWNLLIKVTLEFDFNTGRTVRPDIL